MTYAEDWAEQYQRAYGRPAPKVTVNRGWARIEGIETKYRERDLGAWARELRRMADEAERAK